MRRILSRTFFLLVFSLGLMPLALSADSDPAPPQSPNDQASPPQIQQRSSDGKYADLIARSAALSPEQKLAARKLFSSGFVLWQSGDFVTAGRAFTQGLDIDPANGQANFYYGDCLKRTQGQRNSIEYFSKAIELLTDGPERLGAQEAFDELTKIEYQYEGLWKFTKDGVQSQDSELLISVNGAEIFGYYKPSVSSPKSALFDGRFENKTLIVKSKFMNSVLTWKLKVSAVDTLEGTTKSDALFGLLGESQVTLQRQSEPPTTQIPDVPTAISNLSQDTAQSKYPDLVERSARLSAEQKAQARQLFNTGFSAWQSGNFASAASTLKQGLDIDPADGQGNFYYADSLRQIKDRKNAFEYFSRAVALLPIVPERLKAQVALETLAKPPSAEEMTMEELKRAYIGKWVINQRGKLNENEDEIEILEKDGGLAINGWFKALIPEPFHSFKVSQDMQVITFKKGIPLLTSGAQYTGQLVSPTRLEGTWAIGEFPTVWIATKKVLADSK